MYTNAGICQNRSKDLPVYDILTMADWFYSGLCCKVIPPEDNMEDALHPRKRGAKEGKI